MKKITYLFLLVFLGLIEVNAQEVSEVPFTYKDALLICNSTRTPRDAIVNRNYYDFEYRLLLLAGVEDFENESEELIKEKVSTFFNKYHKYLQCPDSTRIYPMGNYLKQLARNDTERAFMLLLDDYGINPNVIDDDGCTALDYVNKQINSPSFYVDSVIENFKKYKKILEEHGAKYASELGGKC